MTKSTITRERLAKIKSWRETYGAGSNVMLPAEEAEELARMALAAMDSEPVILYRERNPYNGLTTGWQELTENEFSFLKENAGENAEFLTLYRHAQPAPVMPDEINSASAPEVFEIAAEAERLGLRGTYASYAVGWNACRAAMLQASPVCTCPSGDGSLRWPCPVHAGNSPVIGIGLASGQDRTVEVRYVAPPGYVTVPREPTAEMILSAMRDNETGEVAEIYELMLAAAPQSPGSEPATVPGSWIPVSEQMPPSRHEVLVGCWWGEKPRWCCKWATYIPGHPDAQSSGWLIPGASWTPTHWMPLPAGPLEVKGE